MRYHKKIIINEVGKNIYLKNRTSILLLLIKVKSINEYKKYIPININK